MVNSTKEKCNQPKKLERPALSCIYFPEQDKKTKQTKQNKTKQKLDTDEPAIGTKTKLRLNVRSLRDFSIVCIHQPQGQMQL